MLTKLSSQCADVTKLENFRCVCESGPRYLSNYTLKTRQKNRYCRPNKTSTLANAEPSEVDEEYLVMCADKWQIALSLTKLP